MAELATVVKYILSGDNVSALRAMEGVERQSKKTATALEATGTRMKNVGAAMGGVGSVLTRYVSLPLLGIGVLSVKAALSFSHSMDLIRTQAGGTAAEVKKMESAILNLSGHAVAATTQELAEALYPIRSAGFRGAEGLRVLKAAAMGAQTGQAGVVETADALTSVLRSQVKGVKGATDAIALMNRTVGLGKMRLSDLNSAIGTGILPVLQRAGLGWTDYGAALDLATRRGIGASEFTTKLKLSLNQLMAPSGIALTAMRKIGLSQFALADDLKKPQGLLTALEDLKAHLAPLSPEEQSLALSNMFGKSRGSANMALLLGGLSEYKQLLKETGGGKESPIAQFMKDFGISNQNEAVKMKKAIDSLKDSLVSIGKAILPVVVPLFTKLAKIVQVGAEWFGKLPKPVRDAGVYFGMFLVVAGPMLIFFDRLLTSGGNVLTMLGRLGPAAGAAGAEVEGGGLATGLLGLASAVGPLLAAGAAALALYEAVKHLKEFFSSGSGAAHSPAARALKRLHQPSEFQGATGGALRMLAGHTPNAREVYGIAPGSAGEASYLKEHAGYLGPTSLGGKAAAETAEGRAFREAIAHRNEKIELNAIIQLDGKTVAEHTMKYVRDHPTSPTAKWAAEAVNRTAKSERSRGSHG